MIKDKYIPFLGVIVMILTIVALSVGFVVSSKQQSEYTTAVQTESEYMTKVFNKEEMIEINVEVDDSQWENLLQNATDEQYISANLTINGETVSSVGIRAKGNSSLSMVASDDTTDRYSFKIKFDEYIKGQRFYGLDKMVLNNGIGDTTYMKEFLSYDMYQALGIATPGFAFANIKVNGEPWGVYLAVEALEESFVERSFGSLEGNLYKVEGNNMGNPGGGQAPNEGMAFPEGMERPNGGMAFPEGMERPNGEIELPEGMEQPNGERDFPEGMERPNGEMKFGGMGNRDNAAGTHLVYKDDDLSSYSGIFDNTILDKTTDAEKQKVVESIKNLNAGTDLEKYIDVEEVLKYFAINTFVVNLDSYASNMKHNFYLYEENGQLQVLPWDYNLSFAGYGVQDIEKAINFPIDTPVTDTMGNSPLISKLLEVEEYKALYHEYLEQLIADYIENGKFEEVVAKTDQLINAYVKEDKTAFSSYEDYTTSLSHLVQFGKDRAVSIKAQLAGEQPSDDYGTISTTVQLSKLGTMGGGGRMPGMDGENKGDTTEIHPNNVQGEKRKNEENMSESAREGRGNMLKNNRGARGNMPEKQQSQQVAMYQMLLLGIPTLLMGIGIVFVLNYRRRKYRSK